MIAFIFPTQKVDVHMKEALLLLTPEQIDILCSENELAITEEYIQYNYDQYKSAIDEDDLYIYYRMNCYITYPVTKEVPRHMRYPEKIELFLYILTQTIKN